jgi:hypothetical protein
MNSNIPSINSNVFITSADTINSQNVTNSIPNIDEIYSSIEPFWIRWGIKKAANLFVDTYEIEDKILVETAIALEVFNVLLFILFYFFINSSLIFL